MTVIWLISIYDPTTYFHMLTIFNPQIYAQVLVENETQMKHKLAVDSAELVQTDEQ